ncbi:MAG TPA: SPFH domain-containing protein [Thermoanaerobaculia bacterium]|nr:SPFH domain-containing protein [Thermoanaerobaculia bacterium]
MFENLKSPRFRVQSPFLQQVRSRAGKTIFRLLLLLVPLFFLRACVITYVPPDQIGVRQVSYGPGKGLQKKPVTPGYCREIASYETIHTFPRDIQVVEFTDNPAETGVADHKQVGAVKVPTVDGYPVAVDVTVLYRIVDPYKLASKFGFGRTYEEAVVVRFTDPLVKQFLGELLAEQFYHDARLAKVQALRVALAGRLKANGLALTDILIRQYDYPETFQALTEQKKIQDQSVLANRELAKQAEVQTRLNQRMAEGQNLMNVKTAEFNAQITEINARRDLYRRQKQAEADLLVKSAEANGTEQINRALEGAGSAKLLKLRRGLALLNAIKGPIYINEDLTDLGTIAGQKP